MARPRLPMRQFRQIFRLKHEAGLSNRAIACACSVGLGTVSNYLRRAAITTRSGVCIPTISVPDWTRNERSPDNLMPGC